MSEKKRNIIGIILLLLFIGLFTAGYISGEVNIVMNKAINICMECIGIG